MQRLQRSRGTKSFQCAEMRSHPLARPSECSGGDIEMLHTWSTCVDHLYDTCTINVTDCVGMQCGVGGGLLCVGLRPIRPTHSHV
jgi:hypothetical protein